LWRRRPRRWPAGYDAADGAGHLHAVSVSDVDIVLAWSASTDNSGSVNYAVFFDDNPTPFLTSAPRASTCTSIG
jgi:hypothetical protein